MLLVGANRHDDGAAALEERFDFGPGGHVQLHGNPLMGGYRLAGSLLVMTIRAARTGRQAMTSTPRCRLPVAVLAQPMMAGPQKPPDSPMVLISAMPPAAAGPLI
ncbi:hypothetical protein D3C81_1917890 [compost metagenome]